MEVETYPTRNRGQGLVEYSLVIMTIAIAVIATLLFISGQLGTMFSNIGNNLT